VPESKDQVIKPERVLVLSKRMRVRWRELEAGLQGVKSLDDIMRIDLHYITRQVACHPCPLMMLQRPAKSEMFCWLCCAWCKSSCASRRPASRGPKAWTMSCPLTWTTDIVLGEELILYETQQ